MKIAIVTPVFLPYRSGMSQVAAQEAAGLAARGQEVTVFTPDYGQRWSGPINYWLEYLWTPVRFGNAAWLPDLFFSLKKFDLVHLHYPCFGLAEAVACRFLLSRARRFLFSRRRLFSAIAENRRAAGSLVMTYHMDVVGRGSLKLFFKLYKFFVQPLITRAADKIIVSSLDYARAGNLAGLLAKRPDKFVEIPFGVDTDKFAPRPRPPKLVKKLRLSVKDKVILFVGALDKAHYFKGLAILLKALRNLKNTNYKLIIVGDGNLRSTFEKQAVALGLTKQVKFVGRLSDEELPEYYNLADVFVLPSLDASEAYGLVALQALSSGLPVVASNLPGLRQVVGKRGLLVPPGNVAALAQALIKILSDDQLRSQLSEAARVFAVDQVSIKKEIDQLEAVVDSACFN